MIDTREIVRAVQEHGRTKLATQVRVNRGDAVPNDWANAQGVAESLGIKLAAGRRERQTVRRGLLALAALEVGK